MSGTDSTDSNILVVGAGGIGCELLKNLVLDNYAHITIIDLDTIDISNLNRQFLFNKSHVGKSKSEVAREAISKFRPNVDIKAFHKSIFSASFDVEFFQQFDLVFNALDNQAARKHVNRLCFAAKRPLIESGTAGYLGQVEPLLPTGLRHHEKTVKENAASDSMGSLRTACYECQPRGSNQRTFPACTIRNTPSEPIHCIIWAKYLFNQLFGEPDVDDEDISPDPADPEAHQINGTSLTDSSDLQSSQANWQTPAFAVSDSQGTSLRTWYSEQACGSALSLTQLPSQTASPMPAEIALARRLFHDDIVTLVGMRHLWVDRQDRREPTPLSRETVDTALSNESHHLTSTTSCSTSVALETSTSGARPTLRDQRCYLLTGWLRIFLESTAALRRRITDDSSDRVLTWDKDDEEAMTFVASASILRAMLFHLPGADQLTRFSVKSLAGNIIPAIATTNAIVAGLMVLQARHVLAREVRHLRTLYLHRQPTGCRGLRRLVVPCDLPEANPNCHVCSHEANKGNLTLAVRDLSAVSLRQLRDRLLICELGMMAPDVELEERGVILVSSEDGETDEATLDKKLSDFRVTCGCHLRCDDFQQDFTIRLLIKVTKDPIPGDGDKRDDDEPWRLLGDVSEVRAEAQSKPDGSPITNGADEKETSGETDCALVDLSSPGGDLQETGSRKRSLSTSAEQPDKAGETVPLKRSRLEKKDLGNGEEAGVVEEGVLLEGDDEDDLVMID